MKPIRLGIAFLSLSLTPLFAGREEALEKLESETSSYSPSSFFAGTSSLDDARDLEENIKTNFSYLLELPSSERIIILESTATKLLPALYLLKREGYEFNYYGFTCSDISVNLDDSLSSLMKPEDNILTFADLKLKLKSDKKENVPLVIGLELPSEIKKENWTTIEATLDDLFEIIKEYNPNVIHYGGTKINKMGHGVGNVYSRIILKNNQPLYSLIFKHNPSLYLAGKIEENTGIEIEIKPLIAVTSPATHASTLPAIEEMATSLIKIFDPTF